MLPEVVKECFSFFVACVFLFWIFVSSLETIFRIKVSHDLDKRIKDFENTSLDDIAKAYINLNK